MTGALEGSLPTPERSSFVSAVRVAPCPSHAHGHPTVVVTHLSGISAPRSQSRHQNQHVGSVTRLSYSPSRNRERFTCTAQRQRKAHHGRLDDSFESSLWALVPVGFRSEVAATSPGNAGSVTPRHQQQQQRPTALDSISRSGWSLEHGAVGPENAPPMVPSETVFPGSLSKKRSGSLSSPESAKRISPGKRQSHTDDRNPFYVHALPSLTTGQELQCKPFGATIVQKSMAFRSKEPDTPPTLRSRERSMSLETSEHLEYATISPWSRKSPRIAKGSSDFYDSDNVKIKTSATPINTDGMRNDVSGQQVLIPPTLDDVLVKIEEKKGSASRSSLPLHSQWTSTGEVPLRSGRRILMAELLDVANTDKMTRPTMPITPTRPLMNRRLSLSECDSPVTTPTGMMPQVPMHKFVPDTDTSALKELADPPTEGHSPAGIQWTQSLETPTKTHGRRGDTMTPRSNMILRLRGLQPHVSGKQASPGEFAGWSPSMETPPRKATCKADAEHQKISENMLDKLRGIPHDAPLFDDDRQSTVSQEERFYSAPSSIADAEREYQLGVAPASDGDYLVDKGSARFKATAVIIAVRSGSCSSIDVDSTSTDDASSDIASLPDAINLTLSSSIVQELEQDLYRNCSPVMNSQRRFEGSSTPDHASRQVVIENRDSVQLSRTMAISEVMAVERGPLLISNQRGAAIGTSISQDLDNMQLEPWSSPLADTQPKDAQEYHHGSAHRQRSPKLMEEKVVDDFEDIRFSQLDDGFGLPDMTQRPQNVIIDTEMKHNHLSSDDASWHATSAFMFQADSEPDPEDIPSQSVSRATSISVPGGFICASGRKLAVPSKEALTRVTGLLESHAEGISTAGQPEADLSFAVFAGFRSAGGRQLAPVSTAAFAMASGLFGDEASFQEDPVVLEASKISTSSLSFGGFQSAGGKVLAPISKAAEDRAARLLTEDSLIIEAPVPGINDTDAHGHGYAISTNGAIDGQQAVPEQTGGFASASGKKLAPTSKAVMDSWSRRFADDSVADMSRGMSHSAMPILARERFSGFALGAGKQLAVISKAAKTHALSGLNVDGPGLSTPTLQITGTKPVSLENGSSGATGTLDMPKPPAISTHMQKLKLKALRTPSANALMPTGRKSLLKSLEPLRSPRQFKPPLKTNADITAITAATTAATGRAIETAASTTTASSAGIMGDTSLKNSTTSLEVDNADLDDDTCTTVNEVRVPSSTTSRKRKQPNARRPALHPSALVASFPAPSKSSSISVDSHRALFNLQDNGQRAKLSALGSPQRYEARDLLELGVPEDVVYMTLAKAKTYQFDDWGINEAYENLLVRGAHRELLSKSWLANHYAMIVWKLACYVRSWPQKLIAAAEAGSGWFCPDKLLDQLAYRYEREINRAERPALRKVVEGDESPARHMVLAFAEIKSEYSEDAKQDILKASVTDGWYIIPVSLDACLTKAAERGILRIGSKIHVCQAKLTGAESGVAIQEVINGLSSVSMVLQANLTRLARWDKKLGFQREPMVWTTRLRNIMPQGGLVPALDVIVLRRYPVMYLETLEDGTKIRRTAREEDRAAEAHRDAMQKRYQEMVTQVHVMLGVVDGDGPLSSSQPVKVQQEVQARATDLEVQVTARNVMPFFSIRVGDYHHGGRSMEDDNESGHHQEAIITLWHDDVTPFQEGHRIRITSLMAKKSNREYADVKVQLTATRMTTVRRMPTDPEAMLLTAYQPREITTCADIGSLYYGAEVDLVVAVLAVGDWNLGSNKLYIVVTDASRRLLLVEHQLLPSAGLPVFLKCKASVLIANARFKMRDPRLDLDVVSSLQSYTHITAATPGSISRSSGGGWPSYAQPSLHRLLELTGDDIETKNNTSDRNRDRSKDSNSNCGETLVELLAKANTILTQMQPRL